MGRTAGDVALRSLAAVVSKGPERYEVPKLAGMSLDEAMKDGAFGLSTMLMMPPGSLATTDDIVLTAGRVFEGRVLSVRQQSIVVKDEETGLDFEIATIVTDDELNIVAEGPDLVVHATEEQLALMDPVVVDMHTRSGLLDQIRASTITLEDAGAQTLLLPYVQNQIFFVEKKQKASHS